MPFKTADLCDEFSAQLQIARPLLRHFGGTHRFHGAIATVRAPEDNTQVRGLLEQPGGGRVLVVDGFGSRNCALVGDVLGAMAVENGWAGIVVHGCVRDAEDLAALDVGVLALDAFPRKSVKRGLGEVDVEVAFAGVTFTPGHFLYADDDGLLLSERELPT